MFDIGWSEMALIAVVAIVVIGPRDLPRVMRTIGQFTAKARSMARDFQNSMDDLARESDLKETKQQLDRLASFDIPGEFERSIDPQGTMRHQIEETHELAGRMEEGASDITPTLIEDSVPELSPAKSSLNAADLLPAKDKP